MITEHGSATLGCVGVIGICFGIIVFIYLSTLTAGFGVSSAGVLITSACLVNVFSSFYMLHNRKTLTGKRAATTLIVWGASLLVMILPGLYAVIRAYTTNYGGSLL